MLTDAGKEAALVVITADGITDALVRDRGAGGLSSANITR
jgi:hypothetical protein